MNGPLQNRTNVLSSDLTRATNFPDDYDTDLEFEWSNPSKNFYFMKFQFIFYLDLFADGNDFSSATIEKGRNNYYQKKLANQIITKVTEMISLLTTTLNIHLNVGQNLTMNTSEVFMSLETITMDSLFNKQIQQVGNAQIQLPPNFTSNINKNSTISIRVRWFFLFEIILFDFFILVNHGTIGFIWEFQIGTKYKSFHSNFIINS